MQSPANPHDASVTNPDYDGFPDEGTLLLPCSAEHDREVVARRTYWNFLAFSILFASSPCCVLACMALASARLGSIGAWQSGMIYLAFTVSSVTGATYIVKHLGARNAIILGMIMYVLYVGSFIFAISIPSAAAPIALAGAACGGFGGGFLWTAQGVFFSQASERYAEQTGRLCSEVTSEFAGLFACIYLLTEAALELLPTMLIQTGIMSWSTIFGVYSIIAIVAIFGMFWVEDFPSADCMAQSQITLFKKVGAAWYLLRDDSKMKYLVGLNAAFGLAGAFIRSFVNGEVIRIALRDDRSKYVGVFSAWSAVVSSIMALVCDALSRHRGQGFVQILGCLAYFLVVFPFLVLPDLQQWSWGLLGFVYFMYGTGRATFEGSLRAVFADFYPREKEGAFSNIVLQSGSVSTFGFVATYWGLRCKRVGPYCVQYRNGMYHDVLVMELAVAITSMVAIFGYLRAASVFECERRLKQKEDVIQSF